MATPAEASRAAKLVVSTPSLLMMAKASIRFKTIFSRLRRKVCTLISILRFTITEVTKRMMYLMIKRPMI